MLYAAGQLPPPAAPAARAANLKKMHNMHIANSHSSSRSRAPDAPAQPSKQAAPAVHTELHPAVSQPKEHEDNKAGKRPPMAACAAKVTSSLSTLWKGLMLLRWPIIIKL